MRKLSHDLIRIFSIQIIIVLVLTGLVILGYLYRKPMLIVYHRIGQWSAIKAMRRAATPDMQYERYTRHSERFQRHMNALIHLGYLEKRMFQPKFLTAKSPQSDVMLEEFRRMNPRSSYFSIGWGKTLTIIDRPQRMSTWESLIRKYDVPPTDSNQPAASKDLPEVDG